MTLTKYKKSSMPHYDMDSTSESVRKDIPLNNNIPQNNPVVNTNNTQNLFSCNTENNFRVKTIFFKKRLTKRSRNASIT